MHGRERRMRLYRVKLTCPYPDRVRRSSVKYQLPLLQYAWGIDVPISGVNDLQRPTAVGFFTPEVYAEEGPVVEARAENVPGPFEQKRRRGAHR